MLEHAQKSSTTRHLFTPHCSSRGFHFQKVLNATAASKNVPLTEPASQGCEGRTSSSNVMTLWFIVKSYYCWFLYLWILVMPLGLINQNFFHIRFWLRMGILSTTFAFLWRRNDEWVNTIMPILLLCRSQGGERRIVCVCVCLCDDCIRQWVGYNNSQVVQRQNAHI